MSKSLAIWQGYLEWCLECLYIFSDFSYCKFLRKCNISTVTISSHLQLKINPVRSANLSYPCVLVNILNIEQNNITLVKLKYTFILIDVKITTVKSPICYLFISEMF